MSQPEPTLAATATIRGRVLMLAGDKDPLSGVVRVVAASAVPAGSVRSYGRLSYAVDVSKTARIELRVSAEDKDAIASAVAMEWTTTTEFVRDAVLDRARHVRARADRTLMPADQFDALVAALDTPYDTPNLARAFAHKRRFTQR